MRNTLSTPHCVIFDLDGTLVDSRLRIVETVNRVRARFGLSPLDDATVVTSMGGALSAFVGKVVEARDAVRVEEAVAAYRTDYMAPDVTPVQAFPGIRTTLQALKHNNVALAVCTNKHTGLALATLAEAGLDAFFATDRVLGSDMMPAPKPSAEPLHWLMGVCGTTPDRTWMVGDSEVDVLAAKSAGCLSVGCAYGYGDVSRADITVTKPDGLLELVQSLAEFVLETSV